MRKLALGLVGAAGLALGSTAATAATTIITPNTVVTPSPGQTATFFTSGNITNGPIAATFGDVGIPGGSFTDIFKFTIPQTGTGSGSVTTTVDLSGYGGVADLDILSVMVNSMAATPVYRDLAGNVCPTPSPIPGTGSCGATETFAITDVPITANILNTVTIVGTSRGLGSYSGNATFTPTVPEPSTWALMLLGFGAAGMFLRTKRRHVLAQAA